MPVIPPFYQPSHGSGNFSIHGFRFTADYYDGSISGLAVFRERIYRFCCFPEDLPEHHVSVLQELTEEELTEELLIKEKFETLVGTHGSFDLEGNPLPPVMRWEELSQRFYAEKKVEREVDPWCSPVVAWFDIST